MTLTAENGEPASFAGGLKVTSVSCPTCGMLVRVECGDISGFAEGGVIRPEDIITEAQRKAAVLGGCPVHDGPVYVGRFPSLGDALNEMQAELIARCERLVAGHEARGHEAHLPPLSGLSVDMSGEWTPEQVEKFQAEWDRLTAAEARRHPLRLLPPGDPMSREQVRALLRECVTVVEPGETLVIRAPQDWAPAQVEEYQRLIDMAFDGGYISFRPIVVVGDGLAVVRQENADPLADKAAQRGG